MRKSLAILILCAGPAVAQDDALKKEEELLKGVWRITAFKESGRRDGSDSIVYKHKWVLAGTNARMLGSEKEYVKYKLHVRANPKTIDIDVGVRQSVPDQGVTP